MGTQPRPAILINKSADTVVKHMIINIAQIRMIKPKQAVSVEKNTLEETLMNQ